MLFKLLLTGFVEDIFKEKIMRKNLLFISTPLTLGKVHLYI